MLQKKFMGNLAAQEYFGYVWGKSGKISFVPSKFCLVLHLCTNLSHVCSSAFMWGQLSGHNMCLRQTFAYFLWIAFKISSLFPVRIAPSHTRVFFLSLFSVSTFSLDLLAPFLWLATTEKQISASSSHRKSMKAEASSRIPQKLAMRLELVLLLQLFTMSPVSFAPNSKQ